MTALRAIISDDDLEGLFEGTRVPQGSARRGTGAPASSAPRHRGGSGSGSGTPRGGPVRTEGVHRAPTGFGGGVTRAQGEGPMFLGAFEPSLYSIITDLEGSGGEGSFSTRPHTSQDLDTSADADLSEVLDLLMGSDDLQGGGQPTSPASARSPGGSRENDPFSLSFSHLFSTLAGSGGPSAAIGSARASSAGTSSIRGRDGVVDDASVGSLLNL